MSLETLALGVFSGLRPATSQAAVVALLRTSDPRRKLLAFLVAGVTMSVAFGLLVVLALHGASVEVAGSTFSAILYLVAGLTALAYAFRFHRGLATPPGGQPRNPNSNGPTARLARALRHPSMIEAAMAGVATHIPGLVYLIALNAIAVQEPGAASATIQVAAYNLLWFAIPAAALALAILKPDRAPEYIDRGAAWGRSHQQVLILSTLTLLGTYLTIKGAVRLF